MSRKYLEWLVTAAHLEQPPKLETPTTGSRILIHHGCGLAGKAFVTSVNSSTWHEFLQEFFAAKLAQSRGSVWAGRRGRQTAHGCSAAAVPIPLTMLRPGGKVCFLRLGPACGLMKSGRASMAVA